MKPLSISICYCASLFACFKAGRIFEPISAWAVCCFIACGCFATIKEIQKVKEAINQTEK